MSCDTYINKDIFLSSIPKA